MKYCFGNIYPDLSQFQLNKEFASKVFRLRINTIGPLHRDRHLQVDVEQWQDCQRCELFRSCYDLSNAKMTMKKVVESI